jgi:hypothetical protein
MRAATLPLVSKREADAAAPASEGFVAKFLEEAIRIAA